MAERLVGADHAPPDLRAKITGRARYAEDFRAPGMVFMKLLLSPMPHCRVRNVDATRALALPGVIDILRASDVGEPSDRPSESMLTDEPLYEGEPILAIAAVDEETCAAAIELIRLDLEPLPFVLDPLESLRPGGPNAFTGGNQFSGQDGWSEYKWTDAEFAAIERGEMPDPQDMPTTWSKGDVDAAFAEAAYVVMEPIVHQSLTHHPMEPRSTMAYWENGRPFVYVSTQSAQRTKMGLADALDVDPEDLTFVSEYCGGGFGSKIGGHTHMALAPAMSRKIGRPVMHRVTRYEENYIGRARPGFQSWVKMGFRADGKCTAIDLLIAQESGPYGASDYNSAGSIADLAFTPENIRFRGVAMYTNTPPKA
ncbi:MAG: molybdopterin-dependent oxidoreductase, partial [Gemmatimonadota bacterium]|nr:molybdopterin-dependent oxidoreductase [Gemmatimonadota bacterium]